MHKPTVQQNVSLADYTSFGVGGNAEFFVEVHNTEQLKAVLADNSYEHTWLLGYGSNTLIADAGLPGLTICMRGGEMKVVDNAIIADSGIWWDDIVSESIAHNLWGIELLGEIPGSFGAALYINISAYGQSVGTRVAWIEVWDTTTKTVYKLSPPDLSWSYKQSIFQQSQNQHLIILRACLELSNTPTEDLTYQKALDVAQELNLSPDSLLSRRRIIHEARKRAGSLWKPDQKDAHRTVGSFFRNPIVSSATAELIMQFDETGKTLEEIKRMNHVHGGDTKRVSAAHVMLAAGFRRGQTWDKVKLHDDNLLKVEALPGASAQDIYKVVVLIQKTCSEKLGVDLQPEARILGDFSSF